MSKKGILEQEVGLGFVITFGAIVIFLFVKSGGGNIFENPLTRPNRDR
tara:strand:- start:17403 stop:17546 length:144 start_codon:yes stop_codon:yes gene_type:complete